MNGTSNRDIAICTMRQVANDMEADPLVRLEAAKILMDTPDRHRTQVANRRAKEAKERPTPPTADIPAEPEEAERE